MPNAPRIHTTSEAGVSPLRRHHHDGDPATQAEPPTTNMAPTVAARRAAIGATQAATPAGPSRTVGGNQYPDEDPAPLPGSPPVSRVRVSSAVFAVRTFPLLYLNQTGR